MGRWVSGDVRDRVGEEQVEHTHTHTSTHTYTHKHTHTSAQTHTRAHISTHILLQHNQLTRGHWKVEMGMGAASCAMIAAPPAVRLRRFDSESTWPFRASIACSHPALYLQKK